MNAMDVRSKPDGVAILRGMEARCRVRLALWVIASLLGTGIAQADTISWTNTLGGAFSAGGNWQGGTVPDVGDVASFTVAGDYGVDFTTDVTNQKLAINGGSLAFNLGGKTFTVTESTAMVLGDNVAASLLVTNGTLTANQIFMGNATAGNGQLTVGTGGSVSTSAGALYIGRFGSATLIVTNGGLVNASAGTCYVGFSPAGSAVKCSARVTGAGSELRTQGIWVGTGDTRGHTNTLTIAQGGRVLSTLGYVGNNAASRGAVRVTGASSAWQLSSSIEAGMSGGGHVLIENGGMVTNVGYLFVSKSAGSTGSVTIRGTNSRMQTSGVGYWYVGGAASDTGGQGMLAVEDGGVGQCAKLEVWTNGVIRGDGTLIATSTAGLINRGTVVPGRDDPALAGTLTVTGVFDARATAKLAIRVFNDGTHDALSTSTTTKLDGTLDLSFIDYVNSAPRTLTILDWGGTLSGTFSDIQIKGIDPALVNLDNLYVDGTITVKPRGTLLSIR